MDASDKPKTLREALPATLHNAIGDCCFGRDGTLVSWLRAPKDVEDYLYEKLSAALATQGAQAVEFNARAWIMSEMASEQVPPDWVAQLVERAYAAGQPAQPLQREVPEWQTEMGATDAEREGFVRGYQAASKALQPQVEELRKLSEWLQVEADERTKRAKGRRSIAETSRNCTYEDLKAAHAIAEQMSGRKLPRETLAKARAGAEIEDRIAGKMEIEAKRLEDWANLISKWLAPTEEAK